MDDSKTQLLYADPDARGMPTKDGGRRACYNIRAATDADSHMILAFDVTTDRNDMNKLCSTAKIAMENTGAESVEAIADKGYSSSKDVEACLLNGIAPQETLTVRRLKLPGLLRQMESANSGCMGIIRRVCNFKNGAMTLRHAAAGFLEAERGFRRIKGCRQIPILQSALAQLTETGDWSILESA